MEWSREAEAGAGIAGASAARSAAQRPRWLLVSGSKDTTVRLWGADHRCTTILRAHTDYVTCLAALPARGELASGARDGRVLLWVRGEVVRCFEHLTRVTSLAALTDGGLAAGLDDGTVEVWL